MKKLAFLFLSVLAVTSFSCSEDTIEPDIKDTSFSQNVQDIDRTQPDKIEKTNSSNDSD